MRTTWALLIVTAWAGVAAAQAPEVDARNDGAPVPWGFYRDAQGREMQVSFDLGRRIWLGTGYAPRRRATGELEVAPAAFDFGASYEDLSDDGRTRTRWRFLEGEARVHSFGLDVTALRFDLSHRYATPSVRITTFFDGPARHDFYLAFGLYAELGHLERA